nr:MAG TPA: hypothetical protein [Caudoviricetes sp.]
MRFALSLRYYTTFNYSCGAFSGFFFPFRLLAPNFCIPFSSTF